MLHVTYFNSFKNETRIFKVPNYKYEILQCHTQKLNCTPGPFVENNERNIQYTHHFSK